MARESKESRHDRLRQALNEDLFLTDSELARLLGVSIQTVRLDRMEIGIPELRERTRQVAAERLRQVRAISGAEIVGELTHLVLGREGSSSLRITDDMLFTKRAIARGHYLFSQANSLAIAIVDAPVALTGLARVRYRRPVTRGEQVDARAEVLRVVGSRHLIRVVSQVNEDVVFSAKFYIVAKDDAG
ncbi:transcription factor FapR [Heliophilum fasciatum]|uniref:Acyl-coenzyme A thioesterase PaaI-like protein n=1 Tax=Heliophilum fasciatum TaxID=35700 RepID=A0A4R2RLC8_9FIRM|nr:transcription factor FapR [Heliophilum fasciatum]MCW2278413.1 acyl-coenzyme A thioesterase PaaI-like protein [Heliophilum fasciatum]TCP63688.1 acyl-coenzyme A thioesterase PaaI-like protein [Heliophilum fasciatum]